MSDLYALFDTLDDDQRRGWLHLRQVLAERIAPIAAELSGIEADVLCLQEVWSQEAIDAFLEATKDTFPHVFYEVTEEDLTGVTTVEGLPSSLHDYIAMVEDEMKIPVKVVSVGPDRAQTIQR